MNLQQVHDTAVAIAREAGALLREGVGAGTAVNHKTSIVDLVTEYDTAAESLIVEQLQGAFPDHRLVAEEGSRLGDESAEYVWYIDPLDGTNNFAHGYPVFAVSMALVAGTDPLVGVIYDPMRDECFSAVTGQGAWLSTEGERRPLAVSAAERLEQGLIATGFPYDRHTSDEDNLVQAGAFLKRSLGLRRGGAAALDMAYVAAGRLDGYWEFKLKPWDIAAGVLLVREAGGCVTGMDGRPLLLTPMLSLVASNGRLHDVMLETLQSVAAAERR